MKEEIILAAKKYIRDLFAGNAGGHDAAHTLRVASLAEKILAEERSADREKVLLGALLHDADDAKLFSGEGNPNARAFLAEQGITGAKAEEICEIINGVSFSKNRGRRPASLEGKIVQDADRLDAMGAVGIARTFAYGGEHGRPMEDSVQHFHDKLLLLKDEMNTEAGKRMAEERHAYLLEFLRRYEEETGLSGENRTEQAN